MKPETENKLRKIQKVSKVIRAICIIAFVLVAISFGATILVILTSNGMFSVLEAPISLEGVALPTRLLLALMIFLSAAVIAKGLHHLNQLLGNYGRGDVFTTANAGHIRQLGITALLWYAVNMALGTTLVLSHLTHSVLFRSDSLVTGPLIIVISWFMEMAAEMREENELTI